jgi:hypothetical protein
MSDHWALAVSARGHSALEAVADITNRHAKLPILAATLLTNGGFLNYGKRNDGKVLNYKLIQNEIKSHATTLKERATNYPKIAQQLGQPGDVGWRPGAPGRGQSAQGRATNRTGTWSLKTTITAHNIRD